MFWKCYSIDMAFTVSFSSTIFIPYSVLLLSGQMDDRQIDWIAGERELCATLTGRNRWLNLKGWIENSQWKVLETAMMSSRQCQSLKYEMDSCIFQLLMLQTKYSREEEESNNEERNWGGKWKYLLWRKKTKSDGERGTGCGSSLYMKPLPSLLRLVFQDSDAPNYLCRIFAPAGLQAASQHLSQV